MTNSEIKEIIKKLAIQLILVEKIHKIDVPKILHITRPTLDKILQEVYKNRLKD